LIALKKSPLIKRFEQLVKHGDKEACIKALEKLEE
jgi:hypothetical protein